MPLLDAKALGDRVREVRQGAGLTQAQLAETAGITDETVSRLERGAYEPALSTMIAVAEALDVDPFDLVRGEPVHVRTIRSPIARKLQSVVARLDPESQSVLLRLSELLAARMLRPSEGLAAAERGETWDPAHRKR